MSAKLKVTIVLVTLLGASLLGDDTASGVRFQGKQTLIRPEHYREWVFVGSSLGLRYATDPGEEQPTSPSKPASNLYHNVYIDPASYRLFAQTGKFPEGTTLVLELATSETKNEPGLQGSFQGEFAGLEAAVKDSKRFPEIWAYFSFDGPNGERKSHADPFPKDRCWSCHDAKAATDHVFTQFYPVLRTLSSPARN